MSTTIQEKEHREKVEIEKKKLFKQEKELMQKYKRFQSEQKPAQMLLENQTYVQRILLKKVTFTDEAMTKVTENVSVIQQKRINAEREQSEKRNKLSS